MYVCRGQAISGLYTRPLITVSSVLTFDLLICIESLDALGGLQLPRLEGIQQRGRGNGSQGSPGLTPSSLTNSNSAKKNLRYVFTCVFICHVTISLPHSPKGRSKVGGDHPAIAITPLRATAVSPGGGLFSGGPFPGANGKRRSSLSKPNGNSRGKGRGKRLGEVGYLGYTGTEDGFDGLDSPMSTDGGDTHPQVNGLNGEGMDEVSVWVKVRGERPLI